VLFKAPPARVHVFDRRACARCYDSVSFARCPPSPSQLAASGSRSWPGGR
jgi:hypothetical protein